MNELVIISGKGGTGKTSLTASFAVLAGQAVLADCDVDAADLHLILSPAVRERHEFYSGRLAAIRQVDCNRCGLCAANCTFDAIHTWLAADNWPMYEVDPVACEGCGVCVRFCPQQTIEFQERRCGEWMISETRCGPMVHARLGVAAENSGKLVSTVRREARRIAEEQQNDLIIVDGPPGIGCPVIASLTGATQVLAVTEPTVSGEHDLQRVLALARHFGIPAAVCLNKWDLNPELAERIEGQVAELGARVIGRISYSNVFSKAQTRALAVVEMNDPCAREIEQIWQQLGYK